MDEDPNAGIIDFNQGEAQLLLEKVGEMLLANQEGDSYYRLNGETYAVNAILSKDEEGAEYLEVLVSLVHYKKGEKDPELLGIGCFRADDEERLLYSPFLDDDALLPPKAMAMAHSMERLILGEVCEERR